MSDPVNGWGLDNVRSRRQRRLEERTRRWPVLAVVAAVIVAGALLSANRRPAAHASGRAGSAIPVAAPAGALSSSWFCAGATGEPQGVAPGRLIVTNASARTATGTVTLIPSQGRRSSNTFTVPAYSRLTVWEKSPKPTPWLGAVVNLDGGDASVEQQITGSLGASSQPCATAGALRWYFPSGTTLRNAETSISLLNPYQQTAVVDLSFTTENGVEDPGSLQGIVIPADGLVTESLASALPRRSRIATTVIARSGRVVAWKTEAVEPPTRGQPIFGAPPTKAGPPVDPVPPVGGLTVALGASAPRTRWWWADGLAAPGVTDDYLIYNPANHTAKVSLAVHLEAGRAEPLRLNVAPRSVATILANQQARIPSGVSFSATLTSTNGVPVIAERTVSATSPSTRSGLGELMGDPVAASEWLLGGGTADAGTDEWVVITNPGHRSVDVSFSELSDGGRIPVPKLGDVHVPLGGRVGVNLNKVVHQLNNALIVRASGPVVVERDLYANNGRGISLAQGVPMGVTTSR